MADGGVTTEVVLIRHGESVSNATKTIGGPRTCSGLTDVGREQCRRLADRLATTGEMRGAVLMSSQFARAIETARIVGPALGVDEPTIDDGFGEMDPGETADGMTFEAFVEHYGSPDFLSDPEVSGFPGGESVAAMSRRVATAIDRVGDTYPGRKIVVCSHGGTVEAAVRHALGLAAGTPLGLWSTNASITSIFKMAEISESWRLGRFNDAAHLLGGSPW